MTISPKQLKLSPLLKYPGGKEKELNYILPKLPSDVENYYEPFVGGGAVYFALNAKEYFINDKSEELMALYEMVQTQNHEFICKLNQIDHNWRIIEDVVANHSEEIAQIYYQYKQGAVDKLKLHDQVSSFVLHNANEFNGLLSPDFNVGIQNFVNELIKSFKNKIVRMAEIEKDRGELSEEDRLSNIECAFKSAFYMHFRFLYNNAEHLKINRAFRIAIYFYIREFCYSSMFRYNTKGEFNVPYGGISYNRKYITKKAEYFSSPALVEQLSKTKLSCSDFYDFLEEYRPQHKDFMFLDPPYDTEFSTYAKNAFGKTDQERLADYLKQQCDCYFMLIIKNTDFILGLYDNSTDKFGRKITIDRFDKKYFVSFQNRNNKKAEHLIITNY